MLGHEVEPRYSCRWPAGALTATHQMLAEAALDEPVQASESRGGPSHAKVCRPPGHLPVGVLDDLCDGNTIPPAIYYLPQVFPFPRFRLLRWHHIQEFEATSEAVLIILEGQPEKIQGLLTSSMDRHYPGLLPVDGEPEPALQGLFDPAR